MSLPQFVNVLRGDMSMVGPRPPIASEVKRYDLSHLRRLDVLPGMTGLWQVQARQDPSFDSYISLDTAYIQNWSIWLDLKILIRTLSVVGGDRFLGAKYRLSSAPTALGSSGIDYPALPGWAHVWRSALRALGPCLHQIRLSWVALAFETWGSCRGTPISVLAQT